MVRILALLLWPGFSLWLGTEVLQVLQHGQAKQSKTKQEALIFGTEDSEPNIMTKHAPITPINSGN